MAWKTVGRRLDADGAGPSGGILPEARARGNPQTAAGRARKLNCGRGGGFVKGKSQ